MHLSSDVLAIVILCGFVLALVLWVVVQLRRSAYPPGQSVIYFLNLLLTRVLWRTEIVGQLKVSPGQGAVIVSNHRSSVDPFFFQSMPGRVVHWFVAKEYFDLPLVGSFLRATESIPTNRAGVDTKATKMAIRYAHAGELVGMLPEGRINETDQLLLPGRPGAALVALKARVPVIPCYIDGAPYDGTYWGCLFMSAKVRLTVGDPIDLSEYYDCVRNGEMLKELTCRMLREIAALAGRHDFQPQVAGRQWKPSLQD